MNNFIDSIDPLLLIGLNSMGSPVGKALTMQAQAQRQNEAAQAQAAKHRADVEEQMREQAAMQMLPDIVKQLNPSNMQDAIAKLLAAGVRDPGMLNSITKGIQPDMQDKFNPVTGEIVRFQNGMAQGATNGASQGSMRQPSSNPFLNTPVGQAEAAKFQLGIQADKAKATEKKLEEISQAGNDATAAITHLETLESLLPDFYSGFGADVLHTGGQILGNKKSESAQTFDSEAKKLVLKIAANQTGAQSDKDIALIKGASPSLSKNETTNRNILSIAKAAAYREKQYADLAQDWMSKGGDLKEFNKRWRKYTSAFRLVDKVGVGELSLNQDSLKNAEIVLDPNFDQIIGDEHLPVTSGMENSIPKIQRASRPLSMRERAKIIYQQRFGQ